mmetsp:Transcript_1589/g.5605  ORF Transcript_1589/g.5605 Transcript_1589/m.5605 type:complete len:280 (-) Transcript_1589:104-943(-)
MATSCISCGRHDRWVLIADGGAAAPFPVQRLVQACRAHNVQEVFVDGAHAVGQVSIDIQAIGADYYSSNVHKWLFSPTSSAFLRFKPREGEEMHHIVASLRYGQGLAKEYWMGTRDYSPLQAIYDAIQFVEKELDPFLLESTALTDEEWDHEKFPFRYSAWINKKFLAFHRILTETWGTVMPSPVADIGALAFVELPQLPVVMKDGADALQFRHFLRKKFAVEGVFDSRANAARPSGYSTYIRLSVNVYTTSKDIERLRDAVLSVASGETPFSLAGAQS